MDYPQTQKHQAGAAGFIKKSKIKNKNCGMISLESFFNRSLTQRGFKKMLGCVIEVWYG
jgi:hypothetical protein